MTILAIDVGQSGSRVRLTGVDGRLSRSTFRGATGETGDLERLIEEAASEQRHETSRFDVVSVGATGLFGAPPDMHALADRLRYRHQTHTFIVADDAVSCLVGALGETHGVVVAVGTGLVAMGVGPNGAARVDGVGAHIGDEGSGWWIGRRGIIAAISAADGREGGSPLLLDLAEGMYGPLDELPRAIANDAAPAALVARFAELVVDAARAGDHVALQILTEATSFIERALTAAVRAAGLTRSLFSWSLTGGISKASDTVGMPLGELIAARFPHASMVQPIGDPLDGAHALSTTDTSVFGSFVRRYTR